MKFYDQKRRPGLGSVLLVVFLTILIPFALVFSSSAQFQTETIRFINVAAEANPTLLGAASDRHLSGNGTAAAFDVSLANLRAHAVAVGDVNGDGIQDVVMGAPDATFTVGAQTRTNAGVVYVVFGRNTLAGTIDTGDGSNLKILGGKSGDKLGFSVAIGDVNGDGTSDIVIGSPGADFPGSTTPPVAARADTGAVFVILGAASLGTPAIIDLNTTNSANIALFGVNTGEQFGASVAVGNVGGLTSQSPADQAVSDILAGAPGNNGPAGSSRPGAGAAYVQFGGPYLNPVAGATTVRDLATTPANVIVYGRTGDMLGASVAIGDINDGGIADIVMGAPLADRPALPPGVPAGSHTGAVFAIFGGVNLNPAIGTSKTFDISSTQQNVSVYGAGNTNTPGSDDADHLGFSIAIGDVTGDSLPDVLIGAPDADGPTELRTSAGEAYIIQGGSNLNPVSGTQRRLDLFSGDASVTIYGAQAGDRFGSTVAVGNYNTAENTDNTPDFFIGAPGANNKAGTVSILFGGPNILLLALRDIALGQDSLRVLGQSAASNDLSGKSLRIRQTLTSTDQAVTPFLQQLMVSINGGAAVVNDDTQAQFAAGTLTRVLAANTPGIPGDTTALGDLELAPNPALGLDGTTGFMSVSNSASLRPGAGSWTVEFWIKRAGDGTGAFPQVVGARPSTSTATDNGWSVALSSANSFKVGAHFADGSTGNIDLPTVQSTSTVPVGAWQHWAVVFDRAGGHVLFYKNGVLDVSQTVTFPTGAVDQSTAPILIGKSAADTSFLQASLDDIRVWNTARTAQQVSDNFKAELLGTETGLAAYWNFNALDAKDLTANHNDGTLSATGASFVFPTDRRFLNGNRVSTFTFPAASVASSSSISWVQTAAAGTTVKIETSLDNGATFQTASNGSGIPSVSQGDELGWAIAAADLNNDHGGDLIVGAPFANAVTAGGVRTQAGIVYVLPSTTSPPPVNVPPTVEVVAPNGGETLQVGQPFDIKWNASDANGDATIQKFEIRLSTDGGANFNFVITPSAPGTTRKFTWTVPVGFNTTQGRVRVIATDDQSATGQDSSNANFTITDVGVTAILTAPNGGQTLRFNQQFTITWTVPTAVEAQVKGFDLSLSTDSGLTFPIKIAPNSDPSQPALGPTVRSFVWTVPSICTSRARVAVTTTSLTNLRTSDTSDTDFAIGEPGPTIDTANMFLNGNVQLFLVTTAPAGGTEVVFTSGVLVEISSDPTGSTFFTFSKAPKIKKAGGKLLSKGTINGVDLGVFFPTGATRFIRITNPVCGITLLKVTRVNDQLVLATAEEAPLAEPQRVWQ
jgi:hypothetical protein